MTIRKYRKMLFNRFDQVLYLLHLRFYHVKATRTLHSKKNFSHDFLGISTSPNIYFKQWGRSRRIVSDIKKYFQWHFPHFFCFCFCVLEVITIFREYQENICNSNLFHFFVVFIFRLKVIVKTSKYCEK